MKIFFGIFILALGWMIWEGYDISKRIESSPGIAFYDPQAIWESVHSFQRPKKELEIVLKQLQQEYTSLEHELRDESQRLQKERVALQLQGKNDTSGKSHEKAMKALEGRWHAFQNKLSKVQWTVESRKKCIGNVYEKANHQLQEILNKTIQGVAKDKALQMVFSKQGVSFAEQHLNVTPEIVKRLNGLKNPVPLDFTACKRG